MEKAILTKAETDAVARASSGDDKKPKFSINVFLIHITSRKFWVWLLSSFFVNELLHNGTDSSIKLALTIIWAVISVIYLIGEPIEKGIGAMFENAKITAELKAGAQANLSGDISKTGKGGG